MRKITFEPGHKTVEVSGNETVMDAARALGLPVESVCAGRGTCGKCRVRLLEGEREEYTRAERKHLTAAEMGRGVGLACQFRGKGDLRVYLPAVGSDLGRKAKRTKFKHRVDPNPRVTKVYFELPRPTIEDQRSDEVRLVEALNREGLAPLPFPVLSSLPVLLPKADYKVTAVLFEDRVLTVEEGDTTKELYGVAFDIGTTSVVGTLLDLTTGDILAVSSETNRQNVYGADVISRIQYASANPDGLYNLQQKVADVINQIIDRLVTSAGIAARNIYQITTVGNSTMTHLLLGIDPTSLATAPFVPALQSPVSLPASHFGFGINPAGQVSVLPIIAGHVGSDTVAAIIEVEEAGIAKPALMIDIGTNGEIALLREEGILVCSTAAGPAFEGAQISCGMRATEGAIERVEIGDTVGVKVIGGEQAVGICGSGLVDAVAELARAGLIDETGRFVDPEELESKVPPAVLERLKKVDGAWQFVLAYAPDGSEVSLTQKDIRELQLAKAAMRAGSEVLLREASLTPGDLKEIVLAGAFGSYIRKESALRIGLLPAVPASNVKSVGNAAGEGSIIALISGKHYDEAKRLARSVRHVELSIRADFQELFLESMYF